jgi:hypothetical protein
MSEPHQRTQSGKLRRGNIYKAIGTRQQAKQEHKHIYIGVENATSVEEVDPDDELQLYHQTPTILTDTQISIFRKIATGLGIKEDNCIDNGWRRTWNIGTWCIGKRISVSANIVQPNLAGMWANIEGLDASTVRPICDAYKSYGLEKSSATLTATSKLVELKGRWTPYILDSLYSAGATTPGNVKITYVNITQSRLFFWVIVEDEGEYLCTPSQETIDLISRYIPEGAFDITETNAGGGLSIKLRGDKQVEIAKRQGIEPKMTATQISISSVGWVQFTGSEYCVQDLYEVLATSVYSVMHSPHLTAFMDSLEYRIPKETQIT